MIEPQVQKYRSELVQEFSRKTPMFLAHLQIYIYWAWITATMYYEWIAFFLGDEGYAKDKVVGDKNN